jgi:hypothetical protein
MLSGTEDGSMDWEPTMAANTGRMAIEERMVYGFGNGIVMGGKKNCNSMLANFLLSFWCLRHGGCLKYGV